MNTLIVNSHPDFSNPYSFTTILQEKFIELYNEHFPNHQLSILN
ncbi:NAD(P)H-dependent oxidoreductase, partial [Streptococcus agalactiae]|nr:FMN-dependent NADH-azoreductase [Streptococcus agalactiae]MCK6288571.1 NAD(P)H-dependent oxidoreductase [Streptococcus agalactiae]